MSVNKQLYTIPNLLCFFRLGVIPVMVALFYIDTAVAAWTNVVLYALAGASDFFDGRIARATNTETLLGKFLDSSTDKMVVGVSLMLLLAFDRLDGIWIIPAIVIYLREILISGVREFMGLYNVIVPVSRLAKWKLTLQMFFIGFLIAGPYGDMVIPHAFLIGKLGLCLAAVITVLSGWDYTRAALKTILRIETEGPSAAQRP
jgi:cardiolipin synthase